VKLHSNATSKAASHTSLQTVDGIKERKDAYRAGRARASVKKLWIHDSVAVGVVAACDEHSLTVA